MAGDVVSVSVVELGLLVGPRAEDLDQSDEDEISLDYTEGTMMAKRKATPTARICAFCSLLWTMNAR